MAANIRALAAKCVFAIVDKGRSMAEELPKQQLNADEKDRALLQELCYGVIRFLPELEYEIQQLVEKPITGKQRVFHFLILVGFYQIKYMRIPDHAAVSETVNATAALKNKRLKSLVNAILRGFQRKLANKENTHDTNKPSAVVYNHPSWFIKKVTAAYPHNWQEILTANQQRPPMWIRVNQQHQTIEEYLTLLESANIEVDLTEPRSQAIKLASPVDVSKLPNFAQGHVSVQDGAAQQAATLLESQKGDNVLDCCAAPGGKTCHILELSPDIEQMTAIDIDENRLSRVKENLTRLNLTANVIAGDAASTTWWDGKHYDRILLDAPCSGTGVIRRHPDIKWLRKASDIEQLVILQRQILKNIWSLLKPGGTLIYATCSILPEENSEQVQHFVNETADAVLQSITNNPDDIGWQILPNEHAMDGFYYAKLVKKET